MKIPRKLHWLFARALGYFWQPCPNCERYFGGHEIAHDFRKGIVCGSTTQVDDTCMAIWLGCQQCNPKEQDKTIFLPNTVPIDTVFPLAKYALLSGILLVDEKLGVAGRPPEFMGGMEGINKHAKFWRWYRILGLAMTWVSSALMFATHNPWCWLGMAMGFFIQMIATRALPIEATRPWIGALIYCADLLMVGVYVALAIHHLRHM